jgi:adenylosuccinate synthase
MGTQSTRAISIQDIGFGDSGKGVFVDALVRRLAAKCVIRFNGGSQAGHNVVEHSSNGSSRHHTFSQLGSGSFVPGVTTVLLHPFVLHPSALLVEINTLADKGIRDSLSHLYIDARCRITTPYHQAAGCLREKLRAHQAHGTCGVGFGETVGHSISNPLDAISYSDLTQLNASDLLEKLERIRITLFKVLHEDIKNRTLIQAIAEDENWQLLCDPAISVHWLKMIQVLTSNCPARTQHEMIEHVGSAEWVVFEGAQGVLLDEWNGFHPHTTWSTIHTDAVDVAGQFLGLTSGAIHLGVMRSYLTRHGHGPFPSESAALKMIEEPHNTSVGWQGEFRRGHPDALLLRYGVQAIGHLSALAVSHMDIFEKNLQLSWVRQYRHLRTGEVVTSLPFAKNQDLEQQAELADLLNTVQPVYESASIANAHDFLDRVKKTAQLPVWMTSNGPSAQHVLMDELLAQL